MPGSVCPKSARCHSAKGRDDGDSHFTDEETETQRGTRSSHPARKWQT